jgi:hypothetical protein
MSAETYRGIPVPDDWGPVGDVDDWNRGVDAALAVTLPLVESLHWDTSCSFDHHGYCQEHSYLADGPCPDGQAQKFIAATKEEGR